MAQLALYSLSPLPFIEGLSLCSAVLYTSDSHSWAHILLPQVMPPLLSFTGPNGSGLGHLYSEAWLGQRPLGHTVSTAMYSEPATETRLFF